MIHGTGTLNHAASRAISRCKAELPRVLLVYPSIEKYISPGNRIGFGSILKFARCTGLDARSRFAGKKIGETQ
jgi:hypothetical protein